MNVKNSKCIRKLAVKTLKKSFKRNIIAVIAIALTTLLFTGVFSSVFSLSSTMDVYSARMAGCSADGYFENLTAKQFESIENDSRVEDYGYDLRVGTFGDGVFGNKPLEVCYMDDNCAEWFFAKPTEGRMPQNSDEVVVDKGVLEALDVPCELGAEIDVPFYGYYDFEHKSPEVVTLKVVGLYDENVLGHKHYVLVAEEFARSYETSTLMNVCVSGSLSEDTIFDIADDLNIIDSLFDDTQALPFDVYSSSDNSILSGEGIVIIAVFILVLGFSGYLIIYNIFQISVVNDISFYGLLKTIGVTGKQLKRIIRIQALILSAIGIPAGLIGGYIIGILATPQIAKNLIMGSVGTVSSFSPWIFIGSTLFSLITVFISCSKPGKIVSKISPIEAFRYNEVKVDIKKSKKVSGLGGMAVKNLSRNKKKTVLVILSMALPIIILSLGFGLGNGMSFEKYYSADYAFRVSNSSFFNFETPDSVGYVDDYISDEDIENILSNTDFDHYGSAYVADLWAETNDSIVQMFGFDEDLFRSVEVIEGDITPLFDPNSNAVAVSGLEYAPTQLNVGDKVTVCVSNLIVKNSETGEVIDADMIDSTPSDLITYEIVEENKEYEVCAIVDYSFDYWILYSLYDSYEFIMTSDRLAQETNGQMYRYISVFDAADNDAIIDAEEFISDYCGRNNLQYKSETTEREEFKSFEDMFKYISLILCIVLMIIGILNFINAILTGILTRSHELAVLKAIGMTDSQQKKMLITEGVLYTIGSILIGSILYLCLNPLLVALFSDLDYITPVLSFGPMLLITVIFMLFGILIPYVVYNNVAKKTDVERLRVNE